MSYQRKKFEAYTDPSAQKPRYSSLESDYTDSFKNDFTSRFQLVEHHGIQPSLLSMSVDTTSESPLYKPVELPDEPLAGSDDAL